MKTRKTPMRVCAGCQEQKSKKEMIRVVRTPEGAVEVDNKPVDVQSTGLSMLDSTIQSVTAMPSCPGKRRGITNMVAR